jgi:hypothetical protein
MEDGFWGVFTTARGSLLPLVDILPLTEIEWRGFGGFLSSLFVSEWARSHYAIQNLFFFVILFEFCFLCFIIIIIVFNIINIYQLYII